MSVRASLKFLRNHKIAGNVDRCRAKSAMIAERRAKNNQGADVNEDHNRIGADGLMSRWNMDAGSGDEKLFYPQQRLANVVYECLPLAVMRRHRLHIE